MRSTDPPRFEMKVLVVDDSEVMQKLLEGLLTRLGFDVVLAMNGAHAWERFQQDPVPLVLTDWMMPEMSGLELIQRIRGMDLSGYVYIVLMTGRNEKEDLVEAMEAGADDYIAKPIHPGELRVRVREGERIIRLERRLADQNRQLREAQAALVQSEKLASLGQLAAGMSHEINNPIAFVGNNLAVLKRSLADLMALLETYRAARDTLARVAPHSADEAARQEAECDLDWIRENLPQLFDRSLEGLARVRKIVGNLRDFAHLDEAEIDELDINAALLSTADLLHREVEEIQLTVATEFAMLRPVVCRPRKINHVLHSLLLNAIQASSSGKTIVLRTIAAEAGAVIEVEDQGCGIDKAHLPHIFEPFFTTRPVGGGAGLALAGCYGIIRDHGGTIGVQSEVGRGSTFRICLPWEPPQPDGPSG
jgi:signal transduction histidine kinase